MRRHEITYAILNRFGLKKHDHLSKAVGNLVLKVAAVFFAAHIIVSFFR